MTRLAAWVALATVAAVIVGCGPAKELPDEIIKPSDPGEKPVAVPAASEPKAKEYVEKAVKAFTVGKPELVAKGKASRVVLKGAMTLPLENQKTPFQATRTISAVWSDRFFVGNELSGLRLSVGTWVLASGIIVLHDGTERDLGNRTEYLKNNAADIAGQHWMALLVPLTDPKAVVFDLQSVNVTSPQTGQPLPLQTMKLSVHDFPLFHLAFDPGTNLLVRVEYTLTEQGVRRRKQWTALEHKPGPDGQLLPSKTELRHDGQIVEQWELDKWEFPATIPDTEFSPPRK